MNEIARCQRVTQRPNFLLLMGDRYGWQPLPDDIRAEEWDALFPRMSQNEQETIQQWYWRDDNAVPPVYGLQPRRGEYADQHVWNSIETYLRRMLLQALSRLNWSREKRIKYETSVTEQEIEAGIFQYPHAQHGHPDYRRAKAQLNGNRVQKTPFPCIGLLQLALRITSATSCKATFSVGKTSLNFFSVTLLCRS